MYPVDQKAGIPVRRCYGWIENQQCRDDEICIHYQNSFIECVPDSESNSQEFDSNQGSFTKKMAKRSGKKSENRRSPPARSNRPGGGSHGQQGHGKIQQKWRGGGGVGGSNRQHGGFKYAGD